MWLNTKVGRATAALSVKETLSTRARGTACLTPPCRRSVLHDLLSVQRSDARSPLCLGALSGGGAARRGIGGGPEVGSSAVTCPARIPCGVTLAVPCDAMTRGGASLPPPPPPPPPHHPEDLCTHSTALYHPAMPPPPQLC